MPNLVVTRIRDDDTTECCGCGKNIFVAYEVVGRYDFDRGDVRNWSIFLCYNCFQPYKALLEMKKEVKV